MQNTFFLGGGGLPSFWNTLPICTHQNWLYFKDRGSESGEKSPWMSFCACPTPLPNIGPYAFPINLIGQQTIYHLSLNAIVCFQLFNPFPLQNPPPLGADLKIHPTTRKRRFTSTETAKTSGNPLSSTSTFPSTVFRRRLQELFDDRGAQGKGRDSSQGASEFAHRRAPARWGPPRRSLLFSWIYISLYSRHENTHG